MGFCEVEIGGERSGGALDTEGVEMIGDETGEAESGVFRSLVLVVSGFVGFVDDDESKVSDRGEKGGTGADDDLGRSGEEEIFPDFATFFWGEVGVEKSDFLIEGFGKDLDELGGEGDFGDEEDGGFFVF